MEGFEAIFVGFRILKIAWHASGGYLKWWKMLDSAVLFQWLNETKHHLHMVKKTHSTPSIQNELLGEHILDDIDNLIFYAIQTIFYRPFTQKQMLSTGLSQMKQSEIYQWCFTCCNYCAYLTVGGTWMMGKITSQNRREINSLLFRKNCS